MKISKLAFRSIAGLPDISVDLVSSTGRPFDLVVVNGPEASGKTRVLELMLAGLETIGPYAGIVRGADWVGPSAERGRLELGLWLDEAEVEATAASANPVFTNIDFSHNGVVSDAPRALKRLVSRYDHDPANGKREYFPETRQRAWGARRDGAGELEQSLWRASKDPQKYGVIPRFLADLESSPERSRVFAHGLEALSRSVRYTPAASRSEFTERGLTQRACFTTHGTSGVYLSELSSSEANAVLIAATAAMTGLGHSVVFLDRPELHVEPERLVAWVHSLASLGHDNQWFVASGSAHLADAMHPAQVVSLQVASAGAPPSSSAGRVAAS